VAEGANIGTLVGYLEEGIIADCSVVGGSVRGQTCIGGLVGRTGRTDTWGTSVIGCRATVGVTGTANVGGLVGYNHAGSISNCYSTGTVTGDDKVGGLVGYSYFRGSISSSYGVGAVAGRWRTGGLVGCNSGRVSHCYSAADVAGDGRIGGLVGSNYYGLVSDCYSSGVVTGEGLHAGGLVGHCDGCGAVQSFWDIEASGIAHSSGGAGLTTAEMMDPEWIGLQGWANDPNWVLDPYRDYPRLAWEATKGQVVTEPNLDWIAGEGTSASPFEVDDPGQLLTISKGSLFWQKNLVLVADLDLAEIRWSHSVIPDFLGAFDGNGYVIKHLRISGDSYVGLIGRLVSGGSLTNLHLLDADVAGSGSNVGALVGYNDYSNVSNCHSTGKIEGADRVGGLVGWNLGRNVSNCYSAAVVTAVGENVGGLVGGNCGTISGCRSAGVVTGHGSVGGVAGLNYYKVSNCYSTSVVIGQRSVGGVVGFNRDDAYVSNCYATGVVTGTDHVGGLIGANEGDVSNSYSTGLVTGDSCAGGLLGSNWRPVVGSFWDIEASGQATSAGGTGLTTSEMQTAASFLEAGWDFVDEVENGTDEIWWILDGQDYPRLWWEMSDEVSP